jgi:hypothetical protein
MVDGIESAVPYWDAIARTLGYNKRTVYRLKPELQAAGVIFYRKVGRPPRRIVFHFPSRLKTWAGIKGARNELF